MEVQADSRSTARIWHASDLSDFLSLGDTGAGSQLLKNSNALAVVPASGARDVSIILMIIHQVGRRDHA